MTVTEIRKKLLSMQDEEYRDFQSKLVPNIEKDTMIGIRTPEMREVAKEIFKSREAGAFLKDLPHKYYEENLIHFFVIAMIKDFDECIKAVDDFLPYVDCWPVSDQSSPKCFAAHHDKLLEHCKKWIDSDHVYTSRFGMRILMNEYLGSDFRDEYPDWVASKEGDDYYLKMMVAWYFATALAKQYDAVIPFIEERRLDKWTHNKAIQKAIESRRVSEEHKEYLKTLRY